jgi:Glutamine synthetase adenylyltransferase
MREKMRAHLGSAEGESRFDLKHDRGGIVDIEFMVQYLILAHANTHPELAAYTDNIRQLEALANTGCIAAADANALKTTYIRYRALNHEAILAGQHGGVDREEVADERQLVSRYWAKWMN